MIDKLNPCPFCGGEVEIVCIGGGWFWRHNNNPSDTDCVITHSKKYKTYEEVKEHWNRRAGIDIPHQRGNGRKLKELGNV